MTGIGIGEVVAVNRIAGLTPAAAYAIAAGVLVVAVIVALLIGRRSGRRALSQRLTALGTRLGIDPPEDDTSIETALSYLEQVTGAATEAVAESSSDAIRLRRSLDTLPQGVVLCDENGGRRLPQRPGQRPDDQPARRRPGRPGGHRAGGGRLARRGRPSAPSTSTARRGGP